MELLTLLGILSTFIVTLFGHLYTRKNIKTSKYIGVITAERIKWLSTIRNEVSEIVSLITDTLIIYQDEIKNKEIYNPINKNIYDDKDDYQKYYFDSITTNAFKKKGKIELKTLTNKLILLKLRFNPKEDLQILEIIDFFLDFYQLKYKTEKDLETAFEKSDLLINNIQSMLKIEWERVKKETKEK